MAWIELHQSLPTHRKTKKLARLLGLKKCGIPQAVGHLCMLWLWMIDNAQDGDMSSLDTEDIAEAAGWDGKAEAFLDALRESGFVDGDFVHDWDDYAGNLIAQRNARKDGNRERQKRYREKASRVTDASDIGKRHALLTRDSTVTSRVTETERNGTTVPNPTVPNPTVPNPTKVTATTTARSREQSSVESDGAGGYPCVQYASSNLMALSAGNYEEIRQLLEENVPDDLICYAVDQACAAGGRTWAMTRSILDRWRIADITNRAEADENERRFREKKAKGAEKATFGLNSRMIPTDDEYRITGNPFAG